MNKYQIQDEKIYNTFQQCYLNTYSFLKRHKQKETSEILAMKYLAIKDEYLKGDKEFAIKGMFLFISNLTR